MNIPNTRPILTTYLQQFYSHAFFLACHMNIFSTLTSLGETDAQTLAQAAEVHPRMLVELLDVLVLTNLVEKRIVNQQVYYRPTESTSYYLGQRSQRFSMLGFELFQTSTWSAIIAQGADVLRSGKAAQVGSTGGTERWGEVVQAIGAIAANSIDRVVEILQIYSSSRNLPTCKIVDAGCGAGLFGSELLKRLDHLEVIGVDYPAVLELTTATMMREGVAERFTALAGDMCEGNLLNTHGPYDACIVAMVCQVFTPARLEVFFQKVYQALKPGGIFIIIDVVPDDEKIERQLEIAFSFMMSYIGGKAYTQREYRQFLSRSEWIHVNMQRSEDVVTLISAERPA